VLIERGRFSEPDIPVARQQLLKLVNEERLSAGLSQLELDDLAGKVANEHALDTATGGFLSHWQRWAQILPSLFLRRWHCLSE
jgi:hypothetical protein